MIGGFIKEQYIWILQQNACKCYPHPIPSGERIDGAIKVVGDKSQAFKDCLCTCLCGMCSLNGETLMDEVQLQQNFFLIGFRGFKGTGQFFFPFLECLDGFKCGQSFLYDGSAGAHFLHILCQITDGAGVGNFAAIGFQKPSNHP